MQKKLWKKPLLNETPDLKAGNQRNSDEMKMFIGLLLHMGLVNIPRLNDYLLTNPLFKTCVWSKAINRNRFLFFLFIRHFEIKSSIERLNKVAFFMNHL